MNSQILANDSPLLEIFALFDRYRKLYGVSAGETYSFGSEKVVLPQNIRPSLVDWLIQKPESELKTIARGLYERLDANVGRQQKQGAPDLYPGIVSSPWIDDSDHRVSDIANKLASSFSKIKGEYEKFMMSRQGARFQPNNEKCIPRRGNWKLLYLYNWGKYFPDTLKEFPETAAIVRSIGDHVEAPGCAYFSVLPTGASVLPHSDPHNLRLRFHLGISVPPSDCGITVGEETRNWEEGKCLIFDDSFDHVTWNDHTSDRVVFIVDIWHPELSQSERDHLQDMFQSSPLASHIQEHNETIEENLCK